MMETTQTAITDEMLLQHDPDARVEVIDGLLIEVDMPAAGILHVIIINNLYDILKPFSTAHKLGFVHTDSLSYVLERDGPVIINAPVPDVAFVRAHRLTTDLDLSRPFPGAPDLAVEVISPTERTADILDKVGKYLKFGSDEVWVIYPGREELHQYQRDDNAVRIFPRDTTFRPTDLFPGLEIAVADLFVLPNLQG